MRKSRSNDEERSCLDLLHSFVGLKYSINRNLSSFSLLVSCEGRKLLNVSFRREIHRNDSVGHVAAATAVIVVPAAAGPLGSDSFYRRQQEQPCAAGDCVGTNNNNELPNIEQQW